MGANAAEVLPGGNVTNAQPIKQGKYLNFSSNIGNETLSKAGFDGLQLLQLEGSKCDLEQSYLQILHHFVL